MAKFANILMDEAFKVVFAEPSNNRLLIKFVEFFLPGKKIQTLTLDDKEQHGLTLSEKNTTFDLYCTTDTQERFIVEMQFAAQPSFQDRMLYYATYPLRSQIVGRLKEASDSQEPERKKMDYHLNPVYVISVLNFALNHENDETLENDLISRYEIRNGKSGELMTDALHFVYLELGRFKWGKDDWEKCSTLLEKLAFSLKYGHLLDKRPEDMNNELLHLLYDATEFAKMDNYELQRINAIMTTELDIIARREFARNEGLAEGRAEGRAEGSKERSLEIAKNLVQIGIEDSKILQATGITQEQLNELK